MAKATTGERSAPKRRRNAAATREAILLSGRRAFARHGYEGVGVREIAADAGVTAMMVNRYFGSKEKLFAEALAEANRKPVILSDENLARPDLPEVFARALVEITRPGPAPLDGFSILTRSAANARAAEICREQIEGGHFSILLNALDGKLAGERAAVLLAVVAGIQMLRQVVGLTALAQASEEDLVGILAPLFEKLVRPGD